jgi:carboxylesterase type B
VIDTIVKTDLGQVRGLDQGRIVSFRGLPFAAAPEGPLRFQPPAPRTGWDGVRDCAEFGSAPPQLSPAPSAPAAWRPGVGLDCLTLNVWSPGLGAAGLPVMVWIYGGLWKHGSASMPQYDAATLAGSGVVVVTINYRVGFEGFGHIPGVPDNRGLRDQIAALEWVQRNIALMRMPTTWVAEAHTRAGGRTWLYDFAWQSPTIGAGHGIDIPFTFGNGNSRFAARFLGSPPPADFGPLSEQIRLAWTTFAATGDPGWPRFDLEHRRTRIWDTTPSDAEDPIADSRRIWSGPWPPD